MLTAYIAIGSNLGDRRGNVSFGLRRLAALGRVEASPLVLETDDESGLGPPYLNTAARLRTELDDPRLLLEECLRIELERVRARPAPRNSPRTLDLDIVSVVAPQGAEPEASLDADRRELVGEWEWDAPEDLSALGPKLWLVLPHPRAAARAFVTGPLRALQSRGG